MIYLKTLLYGLRLIIVSEYHRITAAVTDSLDLGRNGNNVIGCATV